MRRITEYLKDLYRNRGVIIGLAKNDFKARFATSYLGMVWAYIQPLVTILVMWFVFQVGFKNPPVDDIPFVAWFVPAYLVWSFFSEAVTSVTNSFMEYQYLLKQVNFRVSVIPFIKIISSSFVHLAFIVFIYFIMIFYKMPITLYSIQVIYYFLCTVVLLLALGWLLATLQVFIPDTASVVGLVVQIGFWATPIFWLPDKVTPAVQTVLKLNPMYYICQGYRESFLEQVFFWNHPYMTLAFWLEVLVLLIAGTITFKKLRPYLIDLI